MKNTLVIPADLKSIEEALNFVSQILENHRVDRKERLKAILVVEEAISSLISHAKNETTIKIAVKYFAGKISIEIMSEGEKYSIANTVKKVAPSAETIESGEIQEVISSVLLKAYANDLRYCHKAGKNYVRMTMYRSNHLPLIKTVSALALAIICGVILLVINNTTLNQTLCHYILVPIKTMFLNSLKAIVAPVVFFSIVTCISSFSNLSELGRVGGKIMLTYLFTTFIAVNVGLMSFFTVQPGRPISNLPTAESVEEVESSLAEVLLNSLVGMVPDNFLKPFFESNMLQLIFLAILCGVAIGMIGEYSAPLKNLIGACNEMFLKITTIIMTFMPLAIFCSITTLILTMGIETLISIIGIVIAFLFGIACMMIIYCLLLLIMGRLNPITFLKKYFPSMLQVFSIAASTPSIPINMKACENQLGIDKRVYSFSIPLGATVNMDGTCIVLAVQTLALAKMYGVYVPPTALITFALSIIVFSIGAPGVPGSLIIIMTALLTQLQVPTEAVEIVMSLGPLLGMFLAASNCLGDVIVTIIVAKSEGLIDMKKYNNK